MTYGGLGFFMALRLIVASDRQGIRWNPNGTFDESFLSKWLTRRTIALSLKGRRGGRCIPGELSSDQVFVMTVCYMKCTLPGAVGPQTVGCNRAVSSSEAFVRTFRCPWGSLMNPKKRCTSFTR
ncbi:hypothetical protein HPB51_028140 [Rhipicephalus microplus]|uniref:Secreted protein n=1 Tax=Rhipicephalus microplus TaxID=6941 RepID=A0A9J6CYA5_RHIMP|nr:hypothetical protein HPB51_028140 [Rhipicephalus microplus]